MLNPEQKTDLMISGRNANDISARNLLYALPKERQPSGEFVCKIEDLPALLRVLLRGVESDRIVSKGEFEQACSLSREQKNITLQGG